MALGVLGVNHGVKFCVVAIDTRDDIDYIIITSKGLRNVYTRADGFINKALMYLIKKR